LKKAIASEQQGVDVSSLQLEATGTPVLPRSNQTAATLFDKGRNDTYGE
jgi:hypothetical protein